MPYRKPLIIAIAALAVLLVAYNAIFRWPALEQATAKQGKLIAAIEKRKWGRVHRLTSEHYKDSLGLDRENLVLALKDVGSQFWSSFDLHWEMADIQRNGDTIVITGKMRISGDGGPGAPLVVSYARPYAAKPFTFRWRKVGLAPWSWQLESVDHPDARLPDGYVPGDILRRRGFGDF